MQMGIRKSVERTTSEYQLVAASRKATITIRMATTTPRKTTKTSGKVRTISRTTTATRINVRVTSSTIAIGQKLKDQRAVVVKLIGRMNT